MSEPTPHSSPADTDASAAPLGTPAPTSADALRLEILRRFRRHCAGLGDQALRSAVLAYLTGGKK